MSNMKSSASKASNQKMPKDRRSEFVRVATQLSDVLSANGFPFTMFLDPELPYFSSLPEEEQERVIKSIDAMGLVCASVVKDGLTLDRNRTIAWRMLKALKMRPLGDVFERFEENDLFEIFNSYNQVVYASPWFMSATGYTLEDLYCRPWTELWGRPKEVVAALTEIVRKTIDPSNESTIVPEMPPSAVWELHTSKSRHGTVQPKAFSPVIDWDSKRGFISVNKIYEIH